MEEEKEVWQLPFSSCDSLAASCQQLPAKLAPFTAHRSNDRERNCSRTALQCCNELTNSVTSDDNWVTVLELQRRQVQRDRESYNHEQGTRKEERRGGDENIS